MDYYANGTQPAKSFAYSATYIIEQAFEIVGCMLIV
jgi:hypothetical protein